jgi:hypothetical protein
MNNETAEGHDQPEDKAHGHAGCGEDLEQKALKELAEAKAEVALGEDEIKQGLHDVEQGEHKLEKAKADLEEAERHKVIHFEVDGDPYETRQRVWTPNAIIKEFPKLDSSANYLVRIGHDEANYKNKGEIPIELHECDGFQVIPLGPATVSDGTRRSAIEVFMAGLKDQGFDPVLMPGTNDHVVFNYKVPSGKYAGQQVRLGLVVPPDFPATAPGGLHVSPRVLPINTAGNPHPAGSIHDSPSFQKLAGGEWEYWSRPFQEWGKSKKTVPIYMNHIYRLWDTQ